MKTAGFEASRDQVLDILVPSGQSLRRIVLVGIGDPAKLQARDLELIGGAICGTLQGAKVTDASLAADLPAPGSMSPAEASALLASGIRLRQYSFIRYKSVGAEEKPKLKSVTLLTPEPAGAQRLYQAFDAVAAGVHLARDLVNEPANILTPAEFARRAAAVKDLGHKGRNSHPSRVEEARAWALCSAWPKARSMNRGSSSCNGWAGRRENARWRLSARA